MVRIASPRRSRSVTVDLSSESEQRPCEEAEVFTVATLMQSGLAFAQAHKWKQAATAFRQAVEREPELAEGYWNLGLVERYRGENARAIDALQRAVELDPGNIPAFISLAAVYSMESRWLESATALRSAICLDPHHAQAYYGLGVACSHSRMYPEAIAAFQQAILLMPDRADSYFELGRVHMQLRDWTAAIEMFTKTIRIEPNHANAHYNLRSAMARRSQHLIAQTSASVSAHRPANVILNDPLKALPGPGALPHLPAISRTQSVASKAWQCLPWLEVAFIAIVFLAGLVWVAFMLLGSSVP